MYSGIDIEGFLWLGTILYENYHDRTKGFARSERWD